MIKPQKTAIIILSEEALAFICFPENPLVITIT